jgi:hypothetical protein
MAQQRRCAAIRRAAIVYGAIQLRDERSRQTSSHPPPCTAAVAGATESVTRVGYGRGPVRLGSMQGLEQTRERCLDAGELADFVHGALSPREAAAIERHVARCAACRSLLSLVARSDSRAPLAWAASLSSLGAMPRAPDAAPDALFEGTRVGRYVLRDRLGAGAMGVVFTAHDPELEREIAIKLLRGDLADDAPRLPLTARMLHEAQAMARLAHPNVVAVHDVGWFGDHIFIAMELVQGETLAQWLAGARRSLADVLAMFIAAGNGLAAAHAAGLVHRDFKPENVLVGRDGRVRVTDFGLADRTASPGAPDATMEPRDRPGQLAGTPFYMAPEQLAGEPVDARTDQFGFCVAIYAALTGKHPLRRDGASRDRPPRDRLPAWLWRALRRGLAADRAQRYPAMDDLLVRLARGSRRQRRIAVAGLAAAVAACMALAAVRLGARDPGAGDAAAPAGPRCEGAERLLAGVWDPARARAVEGVFRASGRPAAAADFAAASLLLDQYANRWIAMRTEECERARRDGGTADAVGGKRIDCLDARRGELGLLTDRLAVADDRMIDGAVVAVRALGSLGVCADSDALLRPGRPEVAPRPAEVAAVDGDGRTSYFTTDAEGVVWQVRPGGDGAIADRARVIDGAVGSPVIVLDADRHLQLLVRRVERTLWHAWQGPDGTWRVELLTEGVTDDPAVVIAAGRLVYFVRRADGWLWRYWQTASAPGGWTAVRVAAAVAGRPGAASDVAGELYSFVRKADGSLWSARHPGPGAAPDRWTKLTEPVAGDPIAVRDALGKLTYYVRRADGSLLAGYQHAAGVPIWHGVVLMDSAAGDPAIAFDSDGRQVCLIRTPGGDLWSAIQDTPGTGPWHETILAHAIASDPSVVLGGDRRLAYLVRAADGTLVEGRQDAPRSVAWHTRTRAEAAAPLPPR